MPHYDYSGTGNRSRRPQDILNRTKVEEERWVTDTLQDTVVRSIRVPLNSRFGTDYRILKFQILCTYYKTLYG